MQAALETWPRTGIPENPGAWLSTTARRRAIDKLRHRRMAARRLDALLTEEEARRTSPTPDETDLLALVFTCCHPALSPDAQIALTLRTVGGLSTFEVSRAFLVPQPTIAQRLVRAKQKIRDAKIPFEVPEGSELPRRRDSVLSVIYLIFNEGYLASSGASLMRQHLTEEAIRLGRLLMMLMPGEAEVEGLVALMLLTEARSSGRLDAEGRLVPLDEQDRTLWDRDKITEGSSLAQRALRRGSVGPYQLQAAIAAIHGEARRAADTDWLQIALIYDELYRHTPSPIVALNRVVAWSLHGGPKHGHELMRELEALYGAKLETYCGYHLAWADVLGRLGRHTEAAARLVRAEAEADNASVKRFVRVRRQAVQEAASGDRS